MRKNLLLFTGSTLILFITGFYLYDSFLELVLPTSNNMRVAHGSLIGIFKHQLYFSVIIGLLPIAFYLVWKFANIITLKKKILSATIVLMAIVFAIIINQYLILRVSSYMVSDKIQNIILFENMRYSEFMFAGLVIGSVISWFIFWKPKD